MSADLETLRQTVEKEVRREDFGPGRAGDWAYQIVRSGEPCVTWIDDNQTMCGNPPIGTVDYDHLAELEFGPICSEDHRSLLKKQIDTELRSQGRSTVFGRNGFGREYDKPGPYENR